jgi:hypothetical protein
MGQRDGWLLDRLIVTADAVARHCQLVFHLWLVLQINDGIGLIAGITPNGKGTADLVRRAEAARIPVRRIE